MKKYEDMMIMEFTEKDISQCAEDFVNTFNQEPWNEEWDMEHATEYITDTFLHPKFRGFVLFDQGKKVAYALCFRRYWWSKDNRDELYLELFFVDYNSQNKGYGKILHNHLEEYVEKENLRGIMLTTKRDFPCFHFYRKNGYSSVDQLVTMGKW